MDIVGSNGFLDVPGAISTYAMSINDHGQVAVIIGMPLCTWGHCDPDDTTWKVRTKEASEKVYVPS